MKKYIVRLCCAILPQRIIDLLITYRQIFKLYKLRFIQNRLVASLKGKEVINVIFFALFDSVWKLDYFYKLLEKDRRFNPVIIVCPIVNYGKANMIEKMESCYDNFKCKGFNVIKSYDSITDSYLDIKKVYKPDIIFYTSPYRGLIDDRYYIDNFEDTLTGYVPYFYGETKDQVFVNQPVHNLCWKFFVESDYHKSFCEKNMYNKGKNVVVTGYPGVDYFLDSSYKPSDAIWKVDNSNLKRIIWAPHHTIFDSDMISYSCFLKYSDFMLEMAKKYEDKIQIAFKPHPNLRNKSDTLWGKEKTDEYYSKWDSLKNTFLKDGDYIDLFLTSDAMIHDSGSFLIEYLYVNKPVMRTDNGQGNNELNEFAIECLNYYYNAQSESDIENFILDLIDGKDVLKESRTNFINNTLRPHGDKLPSENVYDYLCEQLL